MCRNDLISSAYPDLKSLGDKYKKHSKLISIFNEEYVKNFEVETIQKYKELDVESFKQLNSQISRSFFNELYLLLLRLMIKKVRNINGLVSRVGSFVFMGIIMTLLFNQMGRDSYSIRDRIGYISMVSVLTIFMTVTLNITTCKIIFFLVSDDRKVFLRERASNLYSVPSYFASKIVHEIPLTIISIFLFSVITYFSTNLNSESSYQFYVYISIQIIASLCASFYGMWIGSMVETEERLPQVMIVRFFNFKIFTIPLMMLTGFFSPESNYVEYLIPLKYLSPFKYIYEVLILNEFKNSEPFLCSSPPNNCDTLADLKISNSYTTLFSCLSALGIFYLLLSFIIVYLYVKVKN